MRSYFDHRIMKKLRGSKKRFYNIQKHFFCYTKIELCGCIPDYMADYIPGYIS